MRASFFTFPAAAALLSGAALLAGAQPADRPVNYTPEPIASAMATSQPVSEAITSIVQALNAEMSLANAKITVQQDGENILLTGRADTREQVLRASEIATAVAGGATVVNVIQPATTVYRTPGAEPTG